MKNKKKDLAHLSRVSGGTDMHAVMQELCGRAMQRITNIYIYLYIIYICINII